MNGLTVTFRFAVVSLGGVQNGLTLIYIFSKLFFSYIYSYIACMRESKMAHLKTIYHMTSRLGVK